MTGDKSKYAIIVAGGSGKRMGSALPKQFLPVAGKPILWHTVNRFVETFNDLQILLVLPKEHFSTADASIDAAWRPRITMIEGGETRFDSVKNGIQAVNKPSVVFVHDAVRCLVSSALIERCYRETSKKGNAIPAIPAVDSMRRRTSNRYETIPRDELFMIQTPQTFDSALLLSAFQQKFQESFTDEATVVENTGAVLNIVEGETENIKITKPSDLLVAEAIIRSKMASTT